LSGKDCNLFIGDKSLILSNPRPYQGWTDFKALLLEVLDHLNRSKIAEKVERFSLKYVNLIEGESAEAQSSRLHLTAKLGPFDLTKTTSHLKTEFSKPPLVTIIEVQTSMFAQMPGSDTRFTGLILSVDSIHLNPDEFWTNREHLIEACHDHAKQSFFEILTEETIKSMEPLYADHS
jgi:uncharacterized protein (TIGR04255 family)